MERVIGVSRGEAKVFIDSARFRLGRAEEEAEANEFAAALLMPESEFRRVVDKHTSSGICNALEVAREFDVSLAVVISRGRWFGMFS